MFVDTCVICVVLPRSETVGTRQCKPKSHIVHTLSPGGVFWARRKRRWLLGLERLALQAMCEPDLDPRNRSVQDARLGQLAGDSFIFVSAG